MCSVTGTEENPSRVGISACDIATGLTAYSAILRALIGRLQGESLELRPTSHGNTWSVYFQDPEQNGIEIFCDTPWQVKQPAGETWDMSLDDEALLAWTREKFQDAERFGPQEEYIARRERELAAASGDD